MLRLTIIIIFIFIQGCDLSDRDLLAPIAGREETIDVEITKWFNDHAAAVSLNYDHGYPTSTSFAYDAIEILKKYNVKMDYDIVSHGILKSEIMKNFLFNTIINEKLGYFGHGHKHDNHDDMSYEKAKESFQLCYNTMKELGLKPISYAYPGGWGYRLSTRRALKDAGFLNGRKFEQLDISDPFIMSNDKVEPNDWYALPTLIMQSEDYDGCIICINNAKELSYFLDKSIEKKAWLILTYHYIGDVNNYGFYYLSEFEKDLIAIKSRDIWNDTMDNITLYAYERKSAKVDAVNIFDEEDNIVKIRIKINDGLPDEKFNQPLTVKLNLPSSWESNDLKLTDSLNINNIYENVTSPLLLPILPNNINYYLQPVSN